MIVGCGFWLSDRTRRRRRSKGELQLLAADDVYSWETGHMTSVVTLTLFCGYRAKLLPPPLMPTLKVPQATRSGVMV